MKNGLYIIIGTTLLFLIVYAFAYATTYIDKRKMKKNQRRSIQSKVVHSREELNKKDNIQIQKPKTYSRRKKETKDRLES